MSRGVSRRHSGRVPHAAAAVLLLMAAVVSVPACRRANAPAADAVHPVDVGPPPKPNVVALGDSITAGYGLLAAQAYPGLLEDRLSNDGYDYEVVNAGVSGDTSAGGLRRLDWTLNDRTRVLIVALGGNDALRGISPAETHKNLASIIDEATSRNIAVLLAGMQAPPNLGEDYKTAFANVFAQLQQEYPDVAYVPFLLEGVAGHPELNQADGIHPNEKGARVVADLLYPKLKTLVDNAGGH